jgi:uridine phosphorylase
MTSELPPILQGKHPDEPSQFTPDSLLREARRQRGLQTVPVPRICVLDPDGDLVRQLGARGLSKVDPQWACYHTTLHRLLEQGVELGIVPFAVGASFAVLVAEELFAAGCELLISVTSSGQLVPMGEPPYFVLIERALRDEGTSYHYLPPAQFSAADADLLSSLGDAFLGLHTPVYRGAVWTTDAPFRETQSRIDEMKALGLLAVEMEAAALYAFAQARGRRVVCVAHVTNQMGAIDGDFEKGEADGALDALAVVVRIAKLLSSRSD